MCVELVFEILTNSVKTTALVKHYNCTVCQYRIKLAINNPAV